ncbi:unnamed protein product (macronuclear) [Paramecium tetraurelia]|uniref:Major facilitator superfamily (MFS) profile domain-containing protein n=1 Tax=Paramecium tetraurelia TaxID=5888 RepID=A0DH24_PARTE|nr:uncharacterized protein GSPATT00016727001 [Paramecium tetraurelia]CAK82341.1 unnamed protein product [Paramecium tetraurelia]|eukprot:XP_001449738.1 hypothetical protein (macronuclear) [Paramecium tetraurelia strain d4-2]
MQVVPLQTKESENLNSESNQMLQLSTSVVLQSQQGTEEQIKSFFHLSVIMIAIQSGNFALGYSLAYLSISFTTLFSQITLKSSEIEEQGLFSAVLSIGQIVGAVMTSPLLKHTTRNQSLFISDVFGVLSILQIIPNREVILAFRFSFGVCLGMSTIIMPLYLKELCPQKYYESFSVMAGFLVGGGYLFVTFLGLGYIDESLNGPESNYWKFIFAFPSLLHFCRSFILTFIYKMDSPITLIQKNKDESAKQILRTIYQEQFIDQAFLECKLGVQQNIQLGEGILSIFTKKHRTTVTIGCVLVFVYTWSGLFALFSYSSQIFSEMSKDDITLNAIFNLIIGIVQFAPAFVSKYVYGRWGKRSLLLFGLAVLILCQILIIGLSYSQELSTVIISFIIICVFSFQYVLTLEPITWSMIPEINSSEGTYFCFVTLYAWQLLVLYIFPLMLDTLAMSGSFIVFLILTLLSTVFFYVFVKETKGLTHKEVNKLYGKD